MTVWYSSELTGYASLPVVKPSAVQYSGNLVIYQASIVFNTQLTTDTIVYAVVPAGQLFVYGVLQTDTSTATATIALGTAASTGKYRAAATFTTTNTPTLYGITAASINGQQLTATETEIVTIGTASLPAAGNLLIQGIFAQSN